MNRDKNCLADNPHIALLASIRKRDFDFLRASAPLL
jgi:hypothetical protein